MANYGLTALMEGIRQSESTDAKNDKLFTLFEATSIDDRVASMVTGDSYDLEEDSVEKDMSGHGIGYDEEEKIKKLIDKIPEDDDEEVLGDIDDDDVAEVIESVLGEI